MKDDDQRKHQDDQAPVSDIDDDPEDTVGDDEERETKPPTPSGRAQREQDRQLESGEENPT